jgi:hypothetical protein
MVLFDKDNLRHVATGAAHSERNRAQPLRPGIITPGVDLSDGLVFPANSSSSTPTTVSDYVGHYAHSTPSSYGKSKRIGLGASNKAKYDKSTRIAAYGWIIRRCCTPGHSPTNKNYHRWDLQVLSHEGSANLVNRSQ